MSLIYPKEDEHRISSDPMSLVKKCTQLHGFDGPKKYFWRFAALLKTLVLTLRTVYACQSLHQPKRLAEIVATYPVRFMAVTKIHWLYLDQNRVKYLFNTISTEFWDFHIAGPEVEKQIKRRFFWANTFIHCHFNIANIGLVAFLVFPLVDMPEGKKPLPNIIWTPFDTNPSPVYEILYIILLWNVILTIIGNAFYDVVFIYSVQHLFVQFMLLKELLKNITKDIMEESSDLEKFSSDYFQSKVYERLKICVAHHIKLLKFGKNLELFTSKVLVPQLIMCYGGLVINGYILSLDHSDVEKSIGLSSVTVTLLIQLAVYSVQSSDIKFQSLSVVEAIADSEWYLFKVPMKTALLYVMMNAEREVVLKAGGMATVDKEVLVDIVQKAFSAVTILRSIVPEGEKDKI